MTNVFVLIHEQYKDGEYISIKSVYESKALATYCANQIGVNGFEIHELELITKKGFIQNMNEEINSFVEDT